jgi:glutamine---fructose-6-phosphate transaminase (isomerizing)
MKTNLLERPTLTLNEILSQPECWSEVLNDLERDPIARKIASGWRADADWIFVGCGTSYYLALAAAASFNAITGRPARAIPASEVLLFPDAVLSDRAVVPVLISRSGRTTEVIRAAEYLEGERNIRTLGVTCSPGQPLARLATESIVVTRADEKSTVMTRSFSAMLLVLQHVAAAIAGKPDLQRTLKRLPQAAEPLFRDIPGRLREFVASHDFEDFVFLGQGPFYGIACEATLKVTESSCSYAQNFHSLEFRHGPKSIVSERTLIGFFLSDTGFAAEVDLLEEVKSLGGTTFVVTGKSDARVRAAADFLVEVRFEGPEYARLAACIPWGQLLGLYTGLKKGLDPDSPRNLSQVVILS